MKFGCTSGSGFYQCSHPHKLNDHHSSLRIKHKPPEHVPSTYQKCIIHQPVAHTHFEFNKGVITFALHSGTTLQFISYIWNSKHNGVCGTEIFNFLSASVELSFALEIDISASFGSQTNSYLVARDVFCLRHAQHKLFCLASTCLAFQPNVFILHKN